MTIAATDVELSAGVGVDMTRADAFRDEYDLGDIVRRKAVKRAMILVSFSKMIYEEYLVVLINRRMAWNLY
jgi:hypothetical protein